MLRAAALAEQRDVELRVVQMPEGVDPAELVAAEGADAIVGKLESALSVVEFAVRRVLAEGQLGTPEGRDRALAQARELIAETPAQSARRDHLVQIVADRLDVPNDYVVTAVANAPRRPAPAPAASRSASGDPGPEWDGDPGPEQRSGAPEGRASAPASVAGPGAVALEAERIFLALCLASGPRGREYLGRLTPDHLSSAVLQRVRDHLIERFDDPLADLDPEDAEFAALVAGIALRADEGEPAEDPLLRMSFLALDLRRIDRAIRHARQDGDLARQAELAGARQQVRRDMDAVMGEVI
jgi:DNA primase